MIFRLPVEPEARAVSIGWWLVYAPQIIIGLAIIWAPILILGRAAIFDRPNGLLLEGVALVVACPASVIFRSFAVPRWRLWAYERASDVGLLKDLAVKEQVLLPDGHVLSRLEIYPHNARARSVILEQLKAGSLRSAPEPDTDLPTSGPSIWQHLKVRGLAFLIATPCFFAIILAGVAPNLLIDKCAPIDALRRATNEFWLFEAIVAAGLCMLIVTADLICAAPGWLLKKLWLAAKPR